MEALREECDKQTGLLIESNKVPYTIILYTYGHIVKSFQFRHFLK